MVTLGCGDGRVSHGRLHPEWQRPRGGVPRHPGPRGGGASGERRRGRHQVQSRSADIRPITSKQWSVLLSWLLMLSSWFLCPQETRSSRSMFPSAGNASSARTPKPTSARRSGETRISSEPVLHSTCSSSEHEEHDALNTFFKATFQSSVTKFF